MPFWYGPQTHREAPGSCIAIQHEIERQSPSTRQDELCAGAVSRAPVLGPSPPPRTRTQRPAGTPPAGESCSSSPVLKQMPFLSGLHLGQKRCFITSLIQLNTAFLTQVAPGNKCPRLCFQSRKYKVQKRKEGKKCPVMNMH